MTTSEYINIYILWNWFTVYFIAENKFHVIAWNRKDIKVEFFDYFTLLWFYGRINVTMYSNLLETFIVSV